RSEGREASQSAAGPGRAWEHGARPTGRAPISVSERHFSEIVDSEIVDARWPATPPGGRRTRRSSTMERPIPSPRGDLPVTSVDVAAEPAAPVPPVRRRRWPAVLAALAAGGALLV